jgi:molybdopterin converting factor small subunit
MAICWIVNAWEKDVKEKTLVNCFQKSNVLPVQGESTGGDDEEEKENEEEEEEEGHDDGDELAKLRAELEQTMSRILAQRRPVQVLALDDFVMPADEEVDDPDDNLTAHIVATIDSVNTESAEDILKETPQLQVTRDNALSNIDSLITYAEQQPSKASDMLALHSLRWLIHQRKAEARRMKAQQTRDRWVKSIAIVIHLIFFSL